MTSARSSDVVVIGGGAIGSCVAYFLARDGASVTLLDASTPGRATSASAGGLWPLGESLGLGCGVIFHATRSPGATNGAQDRVGPEPLPRLFPEPLPRLFMDFLCASNVRFPRLAQELLELTGISIESELGTGLLYLLYDEAQQRHAQAILDWLGADRRRVEAWTPEQVRARDPLVTGDLLGAIHFSGDNQVNPMLLAEALKRAALAKGARFVAEARVNGFELTHGRIDAVHSDAGRFPCSSVVNAAGAWSGQIAQLAGVSIPIHPVRGQIVCTETLKAGTLRSNLSTRDCYILQKSHGEVIIGSTTEHRGFDTSVRYENARSLAAGAVRAVPALRSAIVKRVWAGLRPGTPDELPILGPDGRIENLFHATGGFRTGIVAAPLTADVVAASVLDRPSPVPIEPFLATRFIEKRQDVERGVRV